MRHMLFHLKHNNLNSSSVGLLVTLRVMHANRKSLRSERFMGRLVLLVIFLIVARLLYEPVWARTRMPKIAIVRDAVKITTPTGRLQTIKLSNDAQQGDIKFEDMNFDGRTDIKILRERGANQEFYSIYLYSKSGDYYEFNKEMSDLPCVEADGRTKEVIGACFHQSACENWEEHYSVDAKNKIHLVERARTYCSPTGESYEYVDRCRKGRRTSSKLKEIKEDAK
ncbi:hypothetical protein BurMR1_2778 [Burkholderia sp. MR1]|nr:hypothetical protein BurMR1_2778 [Burkholderia sp. MR1]